MQPCAFEDISLQESIKEDFILVDAVKEQLEGHVDGMEGAQEYSEQSLVRPEDAFYLAQLGWKLEGLGGLQDNGVLVREPSGPHILGIIVACQLAA